MLTIDKNVPRTRATGPRLSDKNREIFDVMDKMEIGDSFSLPVYDRNTAMTVTKRGKQVGKRFSTSRQADGSLRVWRVEPKAPKEVPF